MEGYSSLIKEFIDTMQEIGDYGLQKYGDKCFQVLAQTNNRMRTPRVDSGEIAYHARNHFDMYLNGTKHDKFGTLRHQLAAVAFNAMMEFYFARLDSEK